MTLNDHTVDRSGIFAGDNPFDILKDWLAEASETELNDPNAIALSTVDRDGLPNIRMVLLKGFSDEGFVFYTNYGSKKAEELASGKAAFLFHWKSLRRQIRVRGEVRKYDGVEADEYYASRSVFSRHGAWASDQSQILESRAVLEARAEEARIEQGADPKRPPFWGGFEIIPSEMEFWADGAARLHDRFRWRRDEVDAPWDVSRLYP